MATQEPVVPGGTYPQISEHQPQQEISAATRKPMGSHSQSQDSQRKEKVAVEEFYSNEDQFGQKEVGSSEKLLSGCSDSGDIHCEQDLSSREKAVALALVMLTAGAFTMFIYAHLMHHGSVFCIQPKRIAVNANSQITIKQNMPELNSGKDLRMQQRLPQCIIIGVRKSGTRALLEFLSLHPSIRVAYEEVHFFDLNYAKGLEWYREKMPHSVPEQVTLEKSPAYFITDLAPERIHHMNSSARLLVIVRNPVTRTISDYTQIYVNKMARNKTYPRFEEVIMDPLTGQINHQYKAVRTSLYYKYIWRWLRLFPRSHVHFVDGDKIVVNPLTELVKVEKFLGLDHKISPDQLYFNKTRGFYCMRNLKHERCLGASKGRKHPAVDPVVLSKLKYFFRPYNERFFSLIGQRFNWD